MKGTRMPASAGLTGITLPSTNGPKERTLLGLYEGPGLGLGTVDRVMLSCAKVFDRRHVICPCQC